MAVPRRAAHPAEAPAFDVDLRPVYLLLQAAIITGLLLNRPTQDFFALLFIPISLSAVLFYGKRGFLWIAAFYGGPGCSSHHLESRLTFGRGAGVELRRALLLVRRLRLSGAQG